MIVKHSNVSGSNIIQNSWTNSRMTDHPKIGLDTLQKDIEVDASIILCQSMLIILSYIGTRFPTETGFLAAILNFKAVKMKLVFLN